MDNHRSLVGIDIRAGHAAHAGSTVDIDKVVISDAVLHSPSRGRNHQTAGEGLDINYCMETSHSRRIVLA